VHRVKTERDKRCPENAFVRFQYPKKIVRISPDFFDTISAYVNFNIRGDWPNQLAIKLKYRWSVSAFGLTDSETSFVYRQILCLLLRRRK
jgi:hypothetical protein